MRVVPLRDQRREKKAKIGRNQRKRQRSGKNRGKDKIWAKTEENTKIGQKQRKRQRSGKNRGKPKDRAKTEEKTKFKGTI